MDGAIVPKINQNHQKQELAKTFSDLTPKFSNLFVFVEIA